ncbi:hypothetical protein DOY81_009880 [Sarcophaga bullata]|nr:hypothetical protein DOY81_009880 [Sarcophaga bullata]
MSRKIRKIDKITEILQAIEASPNEKYSAGLAILLVPYILPYNARRNDANGEKATKSEIQKRFIKDYHTMDDLISDEPCNDLQIRFVHAKGKIIYVEFNFCGHLFKSANLLDALNAIFHYIMAFDIEYPKMCLHIWQFIQLAIFQIEIRGCIQPNVQSFINDLQFIKILFTLAVSMLRMSLAAIWTIKHRTVDGDYSD